MAGPQSGAIVGFVWEAHKQLKQRGTCNVEVQGCAHTHSNSVAIGRLRLIRACRSTMLGTAKRHRTELTYSAPAAPRD